jgi:hypothetical protein
MDVVVGLTNEPCFTNSRGDDRYQKLDRSSSCEKDEKGTLRGFSPHYFSCSFLAIDCYDGRSKILQLWAFHQY